MSEVLKRNWKYIAGYGADFLEEKCNSAKDRMMKASNRPDHFQTSEYRLTLESLIGSVETLVTHLRDKEMGE